MTLAHLIVVGEDEIICDLAETYHILDYKALPISLVATLVLGLRNDSRIKLKISDSRLSLEEMLLALIADSLQYISWTKTKAAQKGKDRPKSILQKLVEKGQESNDDLMSFESPEEYEAYMSSVRGKQIDG